MGQKEESQHRGNNQGEIADTDAALTYARGFLHACWTRGSSVWVHGMHGLGSWQASLPDVWGREAILFSILCTCLVSTSSCFFSAATISCGVEVGRVTTKTKRAQGLGCSRTPWNETVYFVALGSIAETAICP